MGKKSPPPKAPDLTPITNAQLQIAKESNELAREFLGMSREQFAYMQENAQEELALARQQADRLFEFQNKAFDSDEAMKEFSKQVGQTQMDAMNLQMEYAKKDRERYEQTFLPMQDRMIDEANAYDTPERREAEASRQMVDVQRQSEAARANADQRLRSMGIDPSQMRSASLLQQQDVAIAANQAMAGNQARQGVEDRGRALRADAINMGMGLPSQAAAGFQGSNASGAGAINAGQAGQGATLGAIQGGAGVGGTAMGFRSGALNNLAQLTGSPMQWAGMGGNMYGQASSAYGNAANTSSQNFQNQMSSWNAGQQQAQQGFQNIMSVASLAGGMMMAEGGPVRRYAEGSPGGVQKESMPLARMAIEGVFERVTPERISKPAGISPTMGERVQRGANMAAQSDPGNVYAQAAPPQALITRQTQFPALEYEMRAEGGRARGAIPIKQARDKIPALLAEGEYVVPEDVVRAKGINFFDKMVRQYHRSNA